MGACGWPISAYAAAQMAADLRISSEVLKTVVFIGTEAGGMFVPLGTAILTSYRLPEDDLLAGVVGSSAPPGGWGFPFLVTATHVLDQISGDTVAVRMNRLDGRSSVVTIKKKERFEHINKANDIVAIPFGFATDIFDQKIILINRADMEKRLLTWSPDLGDEVVTVGLYTTHFGETKNLPVVRVGNIAMMPSEPVLTSAGYIPAYLIETRSLMGLSGSLVICSAPTVIGTSEGVRHLTGEAYVPIGVMLGYHLVASAEDQIQAPKIPGEDVARVSPDERNTGLAVVTPIERIFEIFEQPELQNIFHQKEKERRAKAAFRQT